MLNVNRSGGFTSPLAVCVEEVPEESSSIKHAMSVVVVILALLRVVACQRQGDRFLPSSIAEGSDAASGFLPLLPDDVSNSSQLSEIIGMLTAPTVPGFPPAPGEGGGGGGLDPETLLDISAPPSTNW